jgi:plastocyanin
MRRSMWILATVVVVGAALVPVGPVEAGGGCHDPATEGTRALVVIRRACFGPTVVHVAVGDEVSFINKDDTVHNLIGHGARWGEFEGMSGGETRRFTFSEAGIHPYACTLHPGMVGAVVVGESDGVAAGTGDSGAGIGRTSSTSDIGPQLAAVALVMLVLGIGLLLHRRRALTRLNPRAASKG